MSLRIKFILALLLSSLAAMALVGVVANQRLAQKFGDLVLQDASRAFREDVVAYIGQYGSWQAAIAQESFRAFVTRTRGLDGRSPGVPGTPPPPRMDRSASGPPAGAMPPPGRQRPPFRFLLVDPAGVALTKSSPYEVGDAVAQEDRRKSLPIVVKGETVAYMVPRGEVIYSDMDRGYIAAVRDALLFGCIAAALLAIGLGLFLGTRLSSSLRTLSNVIEQTQKGALGLHAAVRSNDEVGALARAFNQMSSELAHSHEKLRASHAQIEAQAAAMHELSVRDSLTHLHNRRHFDEQAGELCAKSRRSERPLAVMIGDIDHFKQINDRFSHAVGDAVLRQVGEVLRQNTRATDLVARYGGEEFVIAFADTSLDQAAMLCDKLRTAIAAHAWHEVHPDLRVTISIGVAALRRDDKLDKVLGLADDLLYLAKASGRNQVRAEVLDAAALTDETPVAEEAGNARL
ncbi:diguanylate cyclase [Uliginosibacterium sp. H3]|uniref:diguanylate cyclase n=1 Tax=Uliginosibacterium silvisoli TaxID=3114758 RepID=A0ABU6JYT2_9RHOO|nr:diguanylate cyclase [Uliginosibacterium sp. H3]